MCSIQLIFFFVLAFFLAFSRLLSDCLPWPLVVEIVLHICTVTKKKLNNGQDYANLLWTKKGDVSLLCIYCKYTRKYHSGHNLVSISKFAASGKDDSWRDYFCIIFVLFNGYLCVSEYHYIILHSNHCIFFCISFFLFLVCTRFEKNRAHRMDTLKDIFLYLLCRSFLIRLKM